MNQDAQVKIEPKMVGEKHPRLAAFHVGDVAASDKQGTLEPILSSFDVVFWERFYDETSIDDFPMENRRG